MSDTTKTAKIENYTAEQTAILIEEYTNSPNQETVESLAVAMGKSVKSVIAKLARSGVYKKKEYVNKAGEATVSKETYADYIGEALGLQENDVSSLTKANKVALRMIMEFIKAERE